MSSEKSNLVESTLILVLLGVLAGAIGGLGVGMATMPKSLSSTSTSAH
jgi:hypothetical protein